MFGIFSLIPAIINLKYWIMGAVLGSALFFGGRKMYLEWSYERVVKKRGEVLTNCLEDATLTYEEVMKCLEK